MWPFTRKTVVDAAKSRIDNRWTGGTVNLVAPPLEPRDIGNQGARFVETEFQRGRGQEMYRCVLEQGEWAQQYGAIRELNLFASTLAINTDAGPVGIVLWRIAKGPETKAVYEHYLDPLHEPTRRMLQRIETQSRLKVVIRDNRSGETTGFWEFDNNFAMGEFAATIAQAVAGMTAGPFDHRIHLVQRDYPIEDLMALVAQR